MKAKNKQEFKNSWNEHINNLTLLVNAVKETDQIKTLEQIRTIQKELRKIVEKASLDTYGYD